MSILIVGSAGFIGRTLARRLMAEGRTVVGFDVCAHALPGKTATTVTGDVRSAADVARAFEAAGPVETIVHGGGISGSMVMRDDPRAIVDVNVGGTMTLLEEARRRRVAEVVFCSSIMAYGAVAKPAVVETEPLVPVNVYGATKAACEALLHSYAAEFGVRAVQLRIAHVYGAGRMTACPLRAMIAAAIAGTPLRLDAPAATPRQFVAVEDVVDALEAAVAGRRTESAVMNIGPGETKTLAQVADVVGRVVGPVEVTFGCGEVSPDYRTGPLSIDRARDLLGWSPRTSLSEGIRRFAEALRTERATAGGEGI